MKQSNNENLDNLRHSTAHLLAAAVMELWPNTKRTIGPAIENGFYFDFDFGDVKISESDFPQIEKKMRELLPSWKSFSRHELPLKDAKKEYPQNQFKHELIDEFSQKGQKLTFYKSGNYWDLCRGGHIDHPNQDLKHFKLLKIAYWRGSEKNKMLTRIYGTSFPTKKELDDYLWKQEEARKRDHKKLGRELDLFLISDEVGPGLLIWTPKGAAIRHEIEKFIVSEQINRGYMHVYSPHIGKKSLWQTSGHWDLYRDKMYAPMKIDDTEYLVKPMNCPIHMMVYKSHPRSYRDLPLRIAEIASVYRYEQMGELSGMTRVRYITQDDSHIFCRKDQVVDEFIGVLDYTVFLMKAFHIKDYSFRLSLRDSQHKDKYLGTDNIWQEAEYKLETAVKKTGLPYDKCEGEAAFYGPKLDVMIKDALGRQWQCGTIQIDFMLPDRFNLEYINEKGQKERPALIHRAPLGSLERFVGILIEHYAGKFPLWLSPVQTVLIPIADRHLEFAQKVSNQLASNGIRIEIDSRNESMQGKIRERTLQKVPYMGIIGDREVKSLSISIRSRDGENIGILSISDFIERLKTEIDKRS